MKYYSLLLLLIPYFSTAQVAKDYAVMLTATYTESPVNITIHWPADVNATGYSVYKKEKEQVNWGGSIAELPGDAIEYSDDDVSIDSTFEYKVVKQSTIGIEAEGYLLAGIKLHLPDYRGVCLLVVDSTKTSGMENELFRLMKDISGDGWKVERVNVSPTDNPQDIRNMLIAKYEADEDLKCVFLFGRVPVLYSGNLYPDGHPDHEGAWPADAVYGDLNSDYTDEFVDNTIASRPQNWNVPGDGKYDQSVLKSKLEVQIGRVDLFNMPSFAMSEEQLLLNYLNKDHAFRNGDLIAERRALIDDNFGAFGGEAFASSGWRNFAPMFGADQVFESDYLSTMHDATYLWSYGCGGGWFQGASGVGTTTDLAADTVKTIFTFLFGSYFGDWDETDNFLRAPLCNAYTLTNAWAGRPHWHMHHMVLGENIGYSAKTTQNNQSSYVSNIFPQWVHIALMGDPTLRMHVVKPVSNVECDLSIDVNTDVTVSWTPSEDPEVLGYYVYRSSEEFGKYDRITENIVDADSYIDEAPVWGLNYYMVKAVKLEETPSGSYYNLSTGITDSITTFGTEIESISSHQSFQIFPNPAGNEINVVFENDQHTDLISIYNVEGKLLSEFTVSSFSTTIHISHLQPGVYFVKAGNYFRKLVVI